MGNAYRFRAARCSAGPPASTTWFTFAAIRAISTRGPPAAQTVGATKMSCPTSARAKGLKSAATSRSTRPRTTPQADLASRCAIRFCPSPRDFVVAAAAAGIPRGDYNGRGRGGPAGAVSPTQYTIRRGKRSSTYHAFLAGEPEQRPNLTIITHGHATRVILEREGDNSPPKVLSIATQTVKIVRCMPPRK